MKVCIKRVIIGGDADADTDTYLLSGMDYLLGFGICPCSVYVNTIMDWPKNLRPMVLRMVVG